MVMILAVDEFVFVVELNRCCVNGSAENVGIAIGVANGCDSDL